MNRIKSVSLFIRDVKLCFLDNFFRQINLFALTTSQLSLNKKLEHWGPLQKPRKTKRISSSTQGHQLTLSSNYLWIFPIHYCHPLVVPWPPVDLLQQTSNMNQQVPTNHYLGDSAYKNCQWRSQQNCRKNINIRPHRESFPLKTVPLWNS